MNTAGVCLLKIKRYKISFLKYTNTQEINGSFCPAVTLKKETGGG